MTMRFLVFLGALLALNACTYHETPYGRHAELHLPTQTETTVHKTVTINAPEGTTVILQETPPPTVIYQPAPVHRRRW